MAIQEIHDRLIRATRVLEAARVPYAVIGGNAVAEWVGRIDKGAVRFTQDVDILLRRADLPQAIEAMQAARFIFHESHGVAFFLDGPEAGPRDAVHLVFSGEKVRPHELTPAPEVEHVDSAGSFKVISLESLITMKLTAFRRKDQVHLLDMLGVGLIDETWLARLPPPLAERLRELIDNPD